MKRNVFITTGIVTALFVAFALGRGGSAATAQAQEAAVPQQAQTLGQFIEQQSAIFDAQQKRVDDANVIIKDATAKRDQAEQAALGYRYSLCVQYHLQEVSMPAGKSHFVSATTDCSNFQSGTPAAQ